MAVASFTSAPTSAPRTSADTAYDTPWLAHVTRRPDADVRLFCLAAAGTGASAFRHLAKHVPEHIEVLPVQLPGRETRRSESFVTDLYELVDQLAEALEPLLDRPYALCGHSLGGLLSYELAAELTRSGQAPAHLLALATPAPHLQRTGPTVHDKGEDALRQYLVRMAGTPTAVLETRWLFNMYAPILLADLEVFESYVHGKQAALSCPITCWGGVDDQHVGMTALEAWSEHTSHTFGIDFWEGNHFFTRGRDEEFGQRLGRLLPKA